MKLESFDATAKPKIIKEVKALVPNLTLIDVRLLHPTHSPANPFTSSFLFHRTRLLRTFILQAKKFVESLPKILKEALPKEDAEKIKKTFTDLGGVVVLE